MSCCQSITNRFFGGKIRDDKATTFLLTKSCNYLLLIWEVRLVKKTDATLKWILDSISFLYLTWPLLIMHRSCHTPNMLARRSKQLRQWSQSEHSLFSFFFTFEFETGVRLKQEQEERKERKKERKKIVLHQLVAAQPTDQGAGLCVWISGWNKRLNQ